MHLFSAAMRPIIIITWKIYVCQFTPIISNSNANVPPLAARSRSFFYFKHKKLSLNESDTRRRRLQWARYVYRVPVCVCPALRAYRKLCYNSCVFKRCERAMVVWHYYKYTWAQKVNLIFFCEVGWEYYFTLFARSAHHQCGLLGGGGAFTYFICVYQK